MTCEVKVLAGGVLYVSFDYIDGTASVDWSKVAKLESSQLFVVKTADGSVYSGTIKTAETAADQPDEVVGAGGRGVGSEEAEQALQERFLLDPGGIGDG